MLSLFEYVTPITITKTMKKLLMVLLCASILSPSFAYADEHKSEQKKGGESHKAVQMPAQGSHNVETKNSHLEMNAGNEHGQYRPATTTPPVQVVKKTNYYLCKTSAGWNVISVDGSQSLNSANSQGNFCMKLPYGLAKKFNIIPQPTTPDTVAPVVSAIATSALTTTSATISWTTNEVANGRVYYSTSTPVITATSMNAGSATLLTAHTFTLTSLAPSTTYYYVVKSVDGAGNATTSAEQSFTTPAVPDTTAPVISAVANSLVASTTAIVSWTTNELATGKLYFGTSTPLTLFASMSTLSLAHSFNLTGLTASTTYNLIIESSDAAGNTATTTSTLITTN
jgi:hypothetical protein